MVCKQVSGGIVCDAIPVLVEPHDSVDDVKQKIQSAEGTPSIQQRLVFAGHPIVDEKRRFSELRFPRKCSLFIDLYVLDTKVIALFEHLGWY